MASLTLKDRKASKAGNRMKREVDERREKERIWLGRQAEQVYEQSQFHEPAGGWPTNAFLQRAVQGEAADGTRQEQKAAGRQLT
jgi:hypothetical protein